MLRNNRHARQMLKDGAQMGLEGFPHGFGVPGGRCDPLVERLRSLGARTEPYDIVYTDPKLRHQKIRLAAHRWNGPYPDGSVVRFSRSLYGCSAPVLYCQLQRGAPLARSVLLAYELCGTYAGGENSTLGSGLEAVTTVDALRSFAEAHPDFSGARKALKALAFVGNGAASAMEAGASTVICLPVRYGGFGLPVPALNFRMDLENRTIFIDLFWPDARIGIEYDSRTWHVGQHKFEQDSQRRNMSRAAGIELITVTKPEVQSVQAFEDIAEYIAKRLGKRARKKSAEFYEKHAKVRAEVFPFWRNEASSQMKDADPVIEYDPADEDAGHVFGASA